MAEQPDPSTRQRLIDATLAVIDERGVDAVKVTDVAERANTTTGSLYWFFKNRQALVNAALAERYVTHMRAVLASVEESFDRLFTYKVDPLEPARVDARRRQIRVLADALEDPDLATAVAEIQREFLIRATSFVEEAQKAGLARPDIDPYSAALYVQAMAIGLAVIDLAPDLAPDPEKWWGINQVIVQALLTQ